MRPGDLAGKRELVVRDVGLRVPGAVLELDFKAATELLRIDLGPVHPERGADLAGFLYIDLTLTGHDLPPSGGQADRRVRLAELVRAGRATSGLKECQQVGVELVFVSVREAVGCARVDL